MKFAVISASGTQFKVGENEVVRMDRLALKKGEKVVFDKVLLLVDDKKVIIGKPVISKASVVGKVLDNVKGDKIRVARFKAKARYRKVKGSRPLYSNVQINQITYGKD